MNVLRMGALATLASIAVSATAMAAPITTDPGQILGLGQSYAVFAFADANDKDQLTLSSFAGNPIFDNKTSPIGSVVNLGVRTGVQTFTLNNMTSGASFSTGVRDSVDNYFHAFYSTNYADFGVGSLSAAAQASINSLPGTGTVLFVGFEDRRAGDYDYNDLIFAFRGVTVPEPSSAVMLGVGLGVLGLGIGRRKGLI